MALQRNPGRLERLLGRVRTELAARPRVEARAPRSLASLEFLSTPARKAAAGKPRKGLGG